MIKASRKGRAEYQRAMARILDGANFQVRFAEGGGDPLYFVDDEEVSRGVGALLVLQLAARAGEEEVI